MSGRCLAAGVLDIRRPQRSQGACCESQVISFVPKIVHILWTSSTYAVSDWAGPADARRPLPRGFFYLDFGTLF